MRALIKRRGIDLQPLALDAVVHDVVSLIRTEAKKKEVALDCILQPELPFVMGDRVHISQVLLDARRIAIEARATRSGTIEVAVRDSGPGIPDERIEKVFDPFFTTKSEGMGMGLAVSRTIVEAHEGRLWAESGAEGATFRFTLRRA